MIIDDNKDSADTLAYLLKNRGHEVKTVHAGSSALASARSFRPAIVLLDIGLPGISGYEVARQLRDEPELHDLIIIAVSGYGQEEDVMRARESGFDDYAVKPIDPGRLDELIARARRR
jgi:DNA-binding response OmpR family regulator